MKELNPGFKGRIKELNLAESKNVFEHRSVMQALTDEKRPAEDSPAELRRSSRQPMACSHFGTAPKSTAPTVSIDEPKQVLVPSIIKLILQNVRVVLSALLDVNDVTIQYVNAR